MCFVSCWHRFHPLTEPQLPWIPAFATRRTQSESLCTLGGMGYKLRSWDNDPRWMTFLPAGDNLSTTTHILWWWRHYWSLSAWVSEFCLSKWICDHWGEALSLQVPPALGGIGSTVVCSHCHCLLFIVNSPLDLDCDWELSHMNMRKLIILMGAGKDDASSCAIGWQHSEMVHEILAHCCLDSCPGY
jgi:hypothetical protein